MKNRKFELQQKYSDSVQVKHPSTKYYKFYRHPPFGMAPINIIFQHPVQNILSFLGHPPFGIVPVNSSSSSSSITNQWSSAFSPCDMELIQNHSQLIVIVITFWDVRGGDSCWEYERWWKWLMEKSPPSVIMTKRTIDR